MLLFIYTAGVMVTCAYVCRCLSVDATESTLASYQEDKLRTVGVVMVLSVLWFFTIPTIVYASLGLPNPVNWIRSRG